MKVLILLFLLLPHNAWTAQKDLAFLEQSLQKEKQFFREKNWPQFFSWAIFYRQHFLKTDLDRKNYFQRDLLYLELLGLAQLCRFDIIDSLLPEIEKAATTAKRGKDYKFLVEKVLFLKQLKNSAPLSNSPSFDKQAGKLWKLSGRKWSKVQSPHSFRVYVKNKC